jgi:branched-chain amino acid aminotransferase
MKAFRGDDGKLRVFRPWHNMFRMTTSASRSCLPVFDEKEFLDVIFELLRVEQNWVPSNDDLGPGSSLYIRPVLFSTTVSLSNVQKDSS